MKNNSQEAVRCDLTTTLADSAKQAVSRFLTQLGLPDVGVSTSNRMRLTVAAESRRVDFLSKGPFGANVTLIVGPENAYWLHHDAKVFVTLDRPCPPAPTPQPNVAQQGQRSKKGARSGRSKKPASTPTLTMIDPQSGQQVCLRISQNSKCRPAPEMAMGLLQAIFGGIAGELPAGLDLSSLIPSIVEGGFPSSIRFEGMDSRGESVQTLSETRITNFTTAPTNSGDFVPPKGYRPWKLGSKAPEKPGSGFSPVPPSPIDVADASDNSDVGVIRQGLDDDPQGPDEPGTRPPAGPPKPPKPRFTETPRIGFRLEQRLLTQISDLFNSAITPIRTVNIGQGELVFDWLTQMRDDVVRRGSSAPGTAIFPLLHDVALPATRATPPPTPASDFGSFMCRGIVDQIAIRDAELRFRAGTYPTVIVQGFTPATKARIAFAGANWDLLQDSDKARLTFELIRREYGAVRIPFPTGTPPGEPAAGLINFRAVNLAGTLTLPPAPAPVVRTPASSSDPPFNPLLMLTAGFGGTITGTLAIGTLAVSATILRWPSDLFWGVYFATIFAGPLAPAFLFPTIAWAIPIIGSIAVFLMTDIVRASITTSSLSAGLTISFNQNASGVFIPTATCTLTGTATFGWASIVPTGIHQILALIQEGIMNAVSGTLFTVLRDGIADAVTNATRSVLGAGFPATALRLGLPIAGGTRGGQAGVYTYLEASLDLSRDSRYQITPVLAPIPLETAQDADSKRAVPLLFADFYGSLSMDQNFVNAALIGMRLRGLFDRAFAPGTLAPYKALMPAPLPKTATTRMRLNLEAGPSMVLDTQHAVGRANHGPMSMTYALTFQGVAGAPIATLRYRVDTVGQLVLGAAFAPGEGTPFVRIQTVPDRAFDFLIQTGGAALTPISLETVTTQRVETITTEFDSRGKPRKVVEVDFIETVTPVPLTGSLAQALGPLMAAVTDAALGQRGMLRAPRYDGVPAVTPAVVPDPVTMLRYPLGDLDPDAVASISPHVRAVLGLERSLMHFHFGLAGGLGLAFMPFFPPGRGIPLLASFAGSFANGILAAVKVRASSVVGGDLQL